MASYCFFLLDEFAVVLKVAPYSIDSICIWVKQAWQIHFFMYPVSVLVHVSFFSIFVKPSFSVALEEG